MKKNKIFMKSAFLGYINMIATMFIGIISQPLMLKQLGAVEFGIWIVTLNMITYIGNSNVGIPGAALVYIAKSKEEKQKKNIVKKAFLLLSVISIIVAMLFLLIVSIFPNWFLIVGEIDKTFYHIAKITIYISVILFLIRSPLQLAQSAFSGFQDIDINKMYELFNILVPFISLIIIIVLDKSIISLALIVGIGYILVNLIATIHLLLRYSILKDDDINIESVDSDQITYKDLLRSGWEFFIIGVGSALIYNTDSLVISNFVGIAKIPNYNFTFKLYQMAVQVMNIFTGICMPLYGSAYVVKNYAWMAKVYYNMTNLFPIYAGAIWIGGMLIGRDILVVWSGDERIFENYILLFIFGAFVYSLSIVNVNSTLLSGIDKKKESANLIWVEAILNLVLSIILSKYIGITGVALATLISSLTIPYIFLPKYIKKYTEGNLVFKFKSVIKHFIVAVLPILIIITLYREYIYTQTFIFKAVLVIITMVIYFALSYCVLENDYKNEYKNMIFKKNIKN